MLKRVFRLLIVCLVITGCKTAKIVESDTSKGPLTLNTKQLIKAHNTTDNNFETLSGRIKIELLEDNSGQSFSASIRIEKDKQILILSSPISVVKAYLTPTSVKFYNKIDNTYFDGSYAYLSNILGTDIDFFQVQNLLLGKTLNSVSIKSHISELSANAYLLKEKQPNAALEVLYLLNAVHFKLDTQLISQPNKQRLLQIDYTTYQDVESQLFPNEIKITATEGDRQKQINLELKSIKLNESLSFPFSIPSGYKEITFD